MTIRSKQWYTKTSRLEYSFAKSSIGRRSSDRVWTTRSSVRRPVESKFQIFLASINPPQVQSTGGSGRVGEQGARIRPVQRDAAGQRVVPQHRDFAAACRAPR